MKCRLAGLLLLLATPAVTFAQRDTVIARLTDYEGTFEVSRDGITLNIYPQLPLFNGDLIKTGEGRVGVLFSDRSELRLRPDSRARLIEGTAREIEIFEGRAWVFVAASAPAGITLKTGGIVVVPDNARLEYGVDDEGGIDIGIISGQAAVEFTSGGNAETLKLSAGTRAHVGRKGASSPASFTAGDIFSPAPTPAASETAPAVPEPAPVEHRAQPEPAVPPQEPAPIAPEPEPAVPPSLPIVAEPTAVLPEAAAVEPEAPTSAAAEASPSAAEAAAPSANSKDCPCANAPEPCRFANPDEETQGTYAQGLIYALGIGSALPVNSTVRDATDFLSRLDIVPCGKQWEPDCTIGLRDKTCIAGLNPDDPDAPIILPLAAVIESILKKNSALFWLVSEDVQVVSPFAP